MIADTRTYCADVVKALNTRWPEHRTVNFCCHGHSVPSGFFWTPMVDTFHSYPHLLHVGLKERFHWAVINVIVTAFGGECSTTGAERFERDVLSHRPDVLTIDYGLNDRGLPPGTTEKNLTQMIEQATAQGTKVILLTPTWDIRDMDGTLTGPWIAPLREQAEIIRGLANKFNVGLADSFHEFERYVLAGGDPVDIMSGVNHPNRVGHQMVATAMLRYFAIRAIEPSYPI